MSQLNLDFVLIDESVVMNGFRVLMSGAQLGNFLQNPIMLFMHNRAGGLEPVADNVMLAIGKWYDIRIEGNKLLAKPDFDDDDEFAQKIQRKVEKGYYNAASIWLDPIDISEDPNLMLPGQIGPTVTKWGVLEASIVDVPNCRNALAIRNSLGKKIQLTANEVNNDIIQLLRNLKFKHMNKVLVKLGLTEQANETEISQRIDELLASQQRLQKVENENQQLKAEVLKLKQEKEKQRIDALIDAAIKDKKIRESDRDKYAKLAAVDFDTTRELIDSLQPAQLLSEQFKNYSQNSQKLSRFAQKSGRELYLSGELEQLKSIDFGLFMEKYKEAFGVEYVEK